MHFVLSAACIFIGLVVESSGRAAIEWQFYVYLIAGILSLLNAIMWFLLQKRLRKKKLRKAVKNAKDAAKAVEEGAIAAVGAVGQAATNAANSVMENVATSATGAAASAETIVVQETS